MKKLTRLIHSKIKLMDKEEQRILNLFKWLIIISLVGIIIGASIATYNDLKQRTEQTILNINY